MSHLKSVLETINHCTRRNIKEMVVSVLPVEKSVAAFLH